MRNGQGGTEYRDGLVELMASAVNVVIKVFAWLFAAVSVYLGWRLWLEHGQWIRSQFVFSLTAPSLAAFVVMLAGALIAVRVVWMALFGRGSSGRG